MHKLHHGTLSSHGTCLHARRAYIETSLPKLKADNPQLNLSCSGLNNPAVHPQLYAAYREWRFVGNEYAACPVLATCNCTTCALTALGNGRRKSVCVKNYQPAEIHTAIHWLKDSHGRGQYTADYGLALTVVLNLG
eukprot:567924-Pelagomonas_calceolata.AAC.1